MTIDQATQLRARMKGSVGDGAPNVGPRLACIVGGEAGAGATTFSLNVAVELARQGRRAALVTLEPTEHPSAGNESWAEDFVTGPHGVLIGRVGSFDPKFASRIVQHARSLDGLEWLVFDAGLGTTPVSQALAQLANEIVVMTKPTDSSIMASYAAIKLLRETLECPPVRVVINRAADRNIAANAAARLARGCQRFLGIELQVLGDVPEDAAVFDAGSNGTAVVSRLPRSPAARALRHCAEAWLHEQPRVSPLTTRQPIAAVA